MEPGSSPISISAPDRPGCRQRNRRISSSSVAEGVAMRISFLFVTFALLGCAMPIDAQIVPAVRAKPAAVVDSAMVFEDRGQQLEIYPALRASPAVKPGPRDSAAPYRRRGAEDASRKPAPREGRARCGAGCTRARSGARRSFERREPDAANHRGRKGVLHRTGNL